MIPNEHVSLINKWVYELEHHCHKRHQDGKCSLSFQTGTFIGKLLVLAFNRTSACCYWTRCLETRVRWRHLDPVRGAGDVCGCERIWGRVRRMKRWCERMRRWEWEGVEMREWRRWEDEMWEWRWRVRGWVEMWKEDMREKVWEDEVHDIWSFWEHVWNGPCGPLFSIGPENSDQSKPLVFELYCPPLVRSGTHQSRFRNSYRQEAIFAKISIFLSCSVSFK